MADEILKADYSGILTLGETQIPCFVISETKQRLIAMREVVGLLTGNKKGGLERYTNAQWVRDFMPQKYVNVSHRDSTVLCSLAGTKIFGFEGEDIIDICVGYMKARDKSFSTGKPLSKSQYALATQAELLVTACAKTGITALIDEATGYSAVKANDEYQIKFEVYIAKELNKWTKMFPTEFFEQLYKLEGLPIPNPPRPYPKRFGRYVMMYVYDTLDVDFANWLRENNPSPQGSKHHHQWFTDEIGQARLARHLMIVLGMQMSSKTMEQFKATLRENFPDARPRSRKIKERVVKDQLSMSYI